MNASPQSLQTMPTPQATATPDGYQRLLDYDIWINDVSNFNILRKDIFQKRIYHFQSPVTDPVILDCGANIGMSVLYFKHQVPDARVIAFEPDPTIAPYLEENVRRNGLKDVTIVRAALAEQEGTTALHSDGRYGSTIITTSDDAAPAQSQRYDVRTVRLWDYLDQPVDFLKMNIEGAEWRVLSDSAERLRSIRSMVVEYHHVPGWPRTLHKILELLDRYGFAYLIHAFDAETNPHAQPPFRLEPQTRYYLLIYAQRKEP